MSAATTGINSLIGSDWRTEAERRRATIESRLGGRREVVLFGSGYLGRQIARDLDGCLSALSPSWTTTLPRGARRSQGSRCFRRPRPSNNSAPRRCG